MTEERLQSLSIEELNHIAKKYDIDDYDDLNRDELIALVLEVMTEDRIDREESNNSIIKIEEKKFEIIRDEELDFRSEDEFPLPEYYNETELCVLLRDPSWAFAYWNISPLERNDYKNDPSFVEFFFRVFELNSSEYSKESVLDFYDIPLGFDDETRYINLPHSGSYYCVHLMVRKAVEEEQLLQSRVLYSPKDIIETIDQDNVEQNMKTILKLSGLYSNSVSSFGISSFSEGPDGKRIPQRIISFADVQNMRPKG